MKTLKNLRYLLVLFFLSSVIEVSACDNCPICDWHKLQKDNKTFIANPEYAEQREEVVGGQNPRYVILSCSDSRVPPELIFDQGVGDLFVARVAGNVTDAVVVDSIEFAVDNFDVTTLIVMGHTDCGAVIGALGRLRENNGRIDRIIGDHLNAVLVPIEKAIVKAGIDIYAPNAIKLSIRANVSYQAYQLLKRSPIITKAVAKGKIIIVGSEYNLKTGYVKQLFIIDKCNHETGWDEFKMVDSSRSS